MLWLVALCSTATRCSITQKRQILVDFKEFKALCCIVCKLHPCDTFPTQTTLAPHSVPYTVRIQPHYLKAIHFIQPPYFSSLINCSDLTHGKCLSVSSPRPKKTHGDAQFCSCCSNRMEQTPSSS